MAAYKLYNYGHKVKQRTPTPDLDKTLTITALRISSDLDIGGKFLPRSSLVQTPTIKIDDFESESSDEDSDRCPIVKMYDLEEERDHMVEEALKSYRNARISEMMGNNFEKSTPSRRVTSAREYLGWKRMPQRPLGTLMNLLPNKTTRPSTAPACRSSLYVHQIPTASIEPIREVELANRNQQRSERHVFPPTPVEKSPRIKKPKEQVAKRPKTATSDTRSIPAAGKPSYPQMERQSRSTSTYSSLFRSVGDNRKRYFNIHPDWVSENLSVEKLKISEQQRARCRSAPGHGRIPLRNNPIAWSEDL
ncbi:DgyrCDS7152 [Dimorphilus gyrociliatus]|uniref:DgyrCDS7152 n=1 Tax=Dimorphilus gyrociliatus TaxID=2664684 RepID=A0A7I8VQD7_9ANNE|nr:DgyrCDS7152 [Dimorphilus gyrociliatus]